MAVSDDYADKFSAIFERTLFPLLSAELQAFIRHQAGQYRFTLQELRQICEISRDLEMWGEASIQQLWNSAQIEKSAGKAAKKIIINQLTADWLALKNGATRYPKREKHPLPVQKLKLETRDKKQLGLGFCPVASERTRCCNLMTLDAIDNCGFDCSYCSIQAFYHENKIYFDQRFAEKLQALELDPNQTYHIGTGQSSDSLLWGNKHGILDTLTAFACANPNVILELKTKSKNIAYLLEHEIPSNIICTWSLNTPTIISNEEHRAATLDDRINAARQVADRGIVVGFHFHPMIHYDGWREEYMQIFQRLQDRFKPEEVALVSFGTLTYTKSVVKQIRQRGLKSKILQLPLINSDGKLSYSEEVKLEMFSRAYRSFAAWHGQVFFYLCMENNRLWEPVFGYAYPSNEDFESAMKRAYMTKTGAAL
ncbi:MAG: radical SAM protein [Candidatus Polarisedimenticolaceae bacterium]|nr:radical SAM protein [Candidatus Polarisedimenticolaceae bacterium]